MYRSLILFFLIVFGFLVFYGTYVGLVGSMIQVHHFFVII